MAEPISTDTSSEQQEEWRPIVGWEGWYSISNIGRIRRERAAKGTRAGRIIKTRIGKVGYKLVTLRRQNQPAAHFLLHRVLAAAFIGPAQPGVEVNHISGIKTDCRLSNLEYVSRSENIRHAYDTGLIPPKKGDKGEANHFAKTTADVVRRVRVLRSQGMKLKDIAAQVGLQLGNVKMIAAGKTWKHV